METGKLKKRFWPAFVYLVILMLLTAVVEYAYYKDYAYYNIVCFAVDSRGRVLLGKVARVDIYENNVLTDSIEIPLRRAYSINPMRDSGQYRNTAGPRMKFSGTKPQKRPSCEFGLLSPRQK